MLRSKRHWGYSDEFMVAVAPVMTVEPVDLERDDARIEVLEDDRGLLGIIRLQRRTELAFLQDLFVEPAAMGHGHGRRLFERAAEIARGWGKGVLEFESDPCAEPFYLHLGATRVGMSPSGLIPGRAVPLMRYALRDRLPLSG
jgi:GNAT superfamily N-acetyltransferase